MIGIKLPSAKFVSLSSLLVLACAPAARATNAAGWAFADQPKATAAYAPEAQYSFNSAKGAVSIVPTNGAAGGSYTLYFEKIFAGVPETAHENAQVSVADGTSARCTAITSGRSGTTGVVTVQCYNRLGQSANAAFTVLYQIRSAPFGSAAAGLAFLNQGSTGSGADTADSFNSTGGINSATKSAKTGIGAGNYTVTLPGMTRNGGNVQVSSLTGSASQCKVVSWVPNSSATTITVQCYRDSNGAPTYNGFTLAYAIGEPYGLVPGAATLGAWVFANDMTSTSPYRPLANHQYNGFRTGALTAQKTATGKYTVTVPGTLTYSTSTAIVTAVGTGTGYCNIAGWGQATVNIVCFNQAGALADSRFNVTFQTAR